MEYYKNEEVWYNFLKFALLLNRDSYFKPKKEDEIKKSFGYIHNVKEAARKFKDNNKHSEIISMADEIQEILKTDLKHK